MNTVDICPVGALTSKDFRFRQRVWYLKDGETICPGCSTGCNVRAFYNEEGFFRVQPVHNEDVNGYWMCDKGRDIYKFVNPDFRLKKAKWGRHGHWEEMSAGRAAKEAGVQLRKVVHEHGADSVALVLTGQYTSEEYTGVLGLFTGELKSKNVYHWMNNPDKVDEFDGLLLRGDKNPNTRGLREQGVGGNWTDLCEKLDRGQVKIIVVAGPENPGVFPDLKDRLVEFSKAESMIWLSAAQIDEVDRVSSMTWQIPLKTYVEKSGTFVNFEGREQKIKTVTTLVAGALTLSEASQLLAGKEVDLIPDFMKTTQTNQLKTNEFVYREDKI